MITTIGDERLLSWKSLRQEVADLSIDQTLEKVNNWWQFLPIDNPYLHWEDETNWPDPWTIIADGIFCDLTKALGIAYTLSMLERADLTQLELGQTEEGDFLVLVDEGKYILNWAPETVLNTTTLQTQIINKIDASVVTKKIS